MKLIISGEAAADLDRLHAFLANKDAAAARRGTGALIKAMQSLEVFPERGRPSAPSGVRELVVPFGRSAYLLRYLYLSETEEIVILRIWHGREGADHR